jgi:predicted PurR-regulated permease PerM
MSASILRSAVSGTFEILVVVFLSAYLLLAAPRFHRFILRLNAGGNDRRTSKVLSQMAHSMGGYFRGAVIDGIIIAILTWLVLMGLGRPFAAPLAVIAGIGELVPYVGPIVAAVPAIALALLDSPQQALIVAVAYVAIQQIEGHIVTPLVMHSQTDITPGTVLFAVVAGYSIAGILGAIAAVPLFAAARVLVLRVLLPRTRCAAIRRRRRPTRAIA